MIGIVSALYNGLSLQVLHCNVSENNMMLRASKMAEEDVVLD